MLPSELLRGGFVIKKDKNTIPSTYVLSDLEDDENCKKQIKENSNQKKHLKEKVMNCMSNGKIMIIH